MKLKDKTSIICPFVITVDTRESLPYQFKDIKSNVDEGSLPIEIATSRICLQTGDYGIEGETIAIERKTKEDLYGSIVRRSNFVNRLERMSALPWAAVVVEAEWSELINDPPAFTKYNPKSLSRTIFYWSQRYSNVHWFTVPGRRAGEVVTFRLLECFYKDKHK